MTVQASGATSIIKPTRSRANYFSDVIGEIEFHQSFVSLLSQVRKNTISKYLRPENSSRFNHGGQWAHPAAPEALIGEIKKQSTESVVPFAKIIIHDLSVIDEVINKFAEDTETQFVQMMYSSVLAATEKSGNTVDGQAASSPREAYAQLLEKVQFSADKFGNINLPELHIAPEAAEKLRMSIQDGPPEFHQRIEAIKERKIAEAIMRENERKSRFVNYGGVE